MGLQQPRGRLDQTHAQEGPVSEQTDFTNGDPATGRLFCLKPSDLVNSFPASDLIPITLKTAVEVLSRKLCKWFLFVLHPGLEPRDKMSRGRAASPSSRPRRSIVWDSFFISFPQSSLGIRSPNSIANRFSASLQLAIGIVHFLEILSNASQYSLSIDS